MRRARNIALILVGLVAFYGVLGGLVLPPIARSMIAEKAGERLGRTVVVDAVTFNPFTLRAAVKGLRVLEADAKNPFASFDLLEVNASAASLYRLAPVVESLTLAGLKVNVVRESESRYNLSDILERLVPAQPAPAETEKKEPARFSVGNIRVVNAAIDFDDRPIGRKHRVSEMEIAIPFISNLPVHLKDQVQPSFSANVNGAPMKLGGQALPFENTVRTNFTLDIRALDLARYAAYLPATLPVQVGAGKLDASIALRFTQAPGKEASVDIAGTVALTEVAITTVEGPLARFAKLEADIASLDPLGGKIKVTSVRLADTSAMQGEWRVPTLEARDIAVDLRKHAVVIGSLTTQNAAIALQRNRDGSIPMPRVPASQNPTRWDIALGRLALSGYRIALTDATVKPAVTHRLVIASVEAGELSTDSGLKGNAQAKVQLERGGALDVTATFALDPLVVNARLDARGIDLVPLRNYVAQLSTVALKSGAAGAKGSLTLQGKGDAMRISYAGTAEIANLATVDTLNKEDLLNWKAVRTSGIKLEYAPNAPFELSVAEVTVDRIYSRIVLLPDGKLNVQQLRGSAGSQPAAQPAPPPPAPTEPAKPRNVRIDRITFVDSRLNFTDLFIRPNYTADVGELQGTVTGLSSESASRAAVDLKGRWDSSSPVIIKGSVNPLRGDLFLDIAAQGQDIQLPKLTAYAIRYAGYGITGGKLTVDVKYHIENGKMEGRNKIVIDQLTFGDKVEGPDATSLPVLFAVNLLKDSKGRIDLELPISGSLEDPKFAIGALVGQVVGNLLKKAVTSPFSLISAAFGGGGGGAGAASGDELAYLEFEPGRSEISAAGQKKLDALVKALRDRPGLKLELASRHDPVRDMEVLRNDALQKKLAAAPKELSKEAREKLALEPIVVPEEELAALAARRADAVKAALVGEGKLPAERVVVATSPKEAPAGTKPVLGRVDFALR